MSSGVVMAFDGRKGSGLIARDDGREILVHASEVERAGLARLEIGQRLTFDVQTDRALNRSFATNLELA